MGQLVVSAAGAVVGWFVGGPTGAQWGWAIGGAIGAAAFAPKTRSEGTRITDLRVTGTEYGQTIPLVKGRPTITGQMWWASERRPIAITETTEAKGGPEHTSTIFEYEVDLLIGFTYNEMAGVGEIIADGQLVWTVMPGADDADVGAGLRGLRWRRMTFYPGDFEQLPDPTYEAAIGAGMAPAYRGRCYIFFEGYQLGQSGRVPNIQATLFSKGTEATVGYSDNFDDGVTPYSGTLADYLVPGTSDYGPTLTVDTTAGGALGSVSCFRSVPEFTARAVFFKFRILTLNTDDAAAFSLTGTVDQLGFNPAREAAFDPLRRPVVAVGPGGSAVTLSTALDEGQWYAFQLYIEGGIGRVIIRSLPDEVAVIDQNMPYAVPYLEGDEQGFGVDQSGFGSLASVVEYADVYVLPVLATIDDETLQDVVDALIERTKAPAGVFDTSQLAAITTPVRGLAVTQITSTRQVLEYLAACYFFEMYGGTFVPRGGASVGTIEFDKLGATESADPEESPFDITIGSELESPSAAAISYMNIDTQCARDAQYTDRELTDQITTTINEVPLAFTASEAKAIVDAWMLDQRASRKSSRIALLTQEATKYTPTDVLHVTADDGRQFRMRVVRKRESGPVISLEVVAEDASALESLGITSADYEAPSTIPATPLTLLVLIDSGIWRDADDDVGLYAAARGMGTPWPGARLLKSTDDTSYTASVDFIASSIIGTAQTALDGFDGGFVWDELSTVDVALPASSAALASSTRALMQADGSINCAFLASGDGWEAIRYRNAVLVGTNVYRLQGLLRGLQGTEEFIDGHAIGDRFVKLDSSATRRVAMETTEIGATRYFRAPTAGMTLSSATPHTLVHEAIGRKPWRPSNMRCERDTSGNAVITFDRRSRLATRAGGTGGSYIPPADTGETYELDIFDGSVVVRTLTASSPSFDYSAADQTTDFGSAQYPLEVEGFARSILVGRGYGLRASV